MVCRSKSAKFTVLATLLCVLALGAILALPQIVTRLSYAAEAGQALAAQDQLSQAEQVSTAFQTVAKAIRPSVVKIDSVQTIQPAGRSVRPPAGLPDEFRGLIPDDLFDRFGQFDFGAPQEPYSREGLGTGVIVSEDGYVLTNNHVVSGADEVTITLSDNRDFRATVVGVDEKTDLAVLKINASGLVPAKLGDSDAMEVGQWVLAIGTPFGLQQSVTSGIVSAKGRENVGIADYEDFIQTDAAINPGNSGGPLVNLRGEVIGINTAIASRTGTYNGIGFAIPSNMVQTVMQSIMKDGSVHRGFLGAGIQNLTQDLANNFGFKSTNGVLVSDIVEDSPAAKAGLQVNDIVTEYRGEPMRTANQLRNAVAQTTPNTKAQLNVFRAGKSLTLSVNIGLLDDRVATRGPQVGGASQQDDSLGMSVAELTPEIAQTLGYRRGLQGVVVTEVQSAGVASRAGISPRDVIVRVGDRDITSLADFRAAMRDVDMAKGVVLYVRSDGSQRIVFLRGPR